jgi:L,D-transpeptidase ErfK/SrfK
MAHGTYARAARSASAAGAQGLVAVGLALLGGCALLGPDKEPAAPAVAAAPSRPDPSAPRLAPLETRHVALASSSEELVGETQVLFAHYEDTFVAIGREYNLGYEEMRRANPGVDQWLPGAGTPIYLPTQTILPDAPRDGIVVNVPAMRIFYYEKEKIRPAKPAARVAAAQKPAAAAEIATAALKAPAAGASAAPPAATQAAAEPRLTVTTHPIGIGAEGWATPVGEMKVVQKVHDPVWYPPISVRKEHLERGDKLPSVVPPGPDNPLGEYAMTLSVPSYLIHGTNSPPGVGMRSSHGCIRLYPEDIEELFARVARGTHVRIVNQPVLAGWRNGMLYLEVHPPLAEDERDVVAESEEALAKAIERAGHGAPVEIDHEMVKRIATEQRGIPFPVLRGSRTLEQYLAASRIIENVVPVEPAEQTAATQDAAQAGAAGKPSTPCGDRSEGRSAFVLGAGFASPPIRFRTQPRPIRPTSTRRDCKPRVLPL